METPSPHSARLVAPSMRVRDASPDPAMPDQHPDLARSADPARPGPFAHRYRRDGHTTKRKRMRQAFHGPAPGHAKGWPARTARDQARRHRAGPGGAVAIHGLAAEVVQTLAQLDAPALRALAGATPDELTRLARLARQQPEEVQRLADQYGAELLRRLRVTPCGTTGELEAALRQTRARIREPLPGLFESIDVARPPAGWTFQDSPSQEGRGRVLRTDVATNCPRGEPLSGYFIRAYEPATATFEFREAFLRTLPPWTPAGLPLVPGRGTPTAAYVSMYQMRKLGVTPGALCLLRLRMIENVETILHLEWLRQRNPGRSLDELIGQTASVQYAETAIIQSGHRISAIRIEMATPDARCAPIGALFAETERDALDEHGPAERARLRAEHERLLRRYGFTRELVVPMDYDIAITLAPHPAMLAAGPRMG